MINYKRYVIGFAVLVSLVPFIASADAIGDLQSQIQSLLSQIKTLQNQIQTIKQSSGGGSSATTTPPFMNNQNSVSNFVPVVGSVMGMCPQITRDIGVGSRGDDVKDIQRILASDPSIYNGTTTGYFGKQTEQAMMKFQTKFGIASTSTGFVGSVTRDFITKRCPPPPPPQGPNGPRAGGDNGNMMATSTMGMPRPQMPPMPPLPPMSTSTSNQGGRM